MQIALSHPSDTEAKLVVTADESTLAPIKQHVLRDLSGEVKVAGFRAGKVPLELVEKHIDPNRLQTEFLEHAINHAYSQAVQQEKLRVVGQPEINIKKFVPFSQLEFEATMAVVGTIKLANYKKLKAKRNEVKLADDDIASVLDNLRTRASNKQDVDRPAKDGDQIWIDFSGVDAKGKPVAGAEGKDYPLLLGSKSFIPGFEENLIGLKANDSKTFTLTFPKDYQVTALANRKVTFDVNSSKTWFTAAKHTKNSLKPKL
jgi:trigger factor